MVTSAVLASLLDRLPIGVWVGRIPDGGVLYTNAALRELIGCDDAAFLAHGAAEGTGGRLRTRAGAPYPDAELPFPRALAGDAHVVVDDLVIDRPDGSRVDVRAVAQRAPDPAGGEHVVMALVDISAEMRAERERELAQTHLRTAIDHAPIILFNMDSRGLVTLSEGAGLATLGLKPGEIVGHSIFEVFPEYPAVGDLASRGLAGESFRQVVELRGAAFECSAAPVRDDVGRVIGLTGVATDITERTRLEGRIAQTERLRAVATLAASVAHEINNPLAYVLAQLCEIGGELERLDASADAATPARLRRGLRDLRELLVPVRESAERVSAVARGLGNLAGQEPANDDALDVRRVVRSVVQLVSHQCARFARLTTDLQPTDPIAGREPRLGQLVFNLLSNAIEAVSDSAAGPHEIRVRTAMQGERVLLEVSDTGPGVPTELREQIFEPFVTTKTQRGGQGLGLFVSRKLARELGGELTLLDTPGRGATFRVDLPRTTAALPAEPELELPSGALQVLVIDDDIALGRVFKRSLLRAGYHARSVRGGQAALELLHKGAHVDLILCDLMMDGMSGSEFHSAIREQLPALEDRIVFMTGGAVPARERTVFRERGLAMVQKPFDVVAEVGRQLSLRASNAPG